MPAGSLLSYVLGENDKLLFAKEGFAIVAIAWILISVVGAIPYVISGTIPSFANAFFETVSGFTTTGASVLHDVESLSKGILFWRSFTHWLGGMVGPMGNYAAFSIPAKLLLSFTMLLGRLEIFPMLMLFMPSFWNRK